MVKPSKSLKKIFVESPGPSNLQQVFFLYLKGMAMGVADLIPGVSGGTIAFIVGIYQQMLAALASLNSRFFKNIFKLRFKAALEIVHFKFLSVLILGIISSMLLFAKLMSFLLEHHSIPTWGFFLGLIVASIALLFSQICRDGQIKKAITPLTLGTIFAYLIVSLIPVDTPEHLSFIFICGLIGVSAMVLPGISGSFLILILGKYEFITNALKNPLVLDNAIVLLVFVSGAVTGIISVVKVFNYFLKRYPLTSFAFLTGVMIGSLKKVWPWKETVLYKIVRGKVKIIQEKNILPTSYDTEFYITLLACFFGIVAVYFLGKKPKSEA